MAVGSASDRTGRLEVRPEEHAALRQLARCLAGETHAGLLDAATCLEVVR